MLQQPLVLSKIPCVLLLAFSANALSGETETAEWGPGGAVSPAQVTRGPYLQMQTDDGIILRWRTDIATDSVVRYGTSAGILNSTVSVAGSRTEHEVSLSGLGSAQQYWYSVGDSVSAIAGDSSYHFSTAPVQGLAADTRLWVIGDSGTANPSARAVRDAFKAYTTSDPADLWLMLGDNAYNDGTDAEYQVAVFDTYPEILRQLPLWSTLGNHDGQTADSATQSGPYYDIFNLPANGEIGGLSSGTEAYYSFDYANIHFICLESYETDRSANGNMMTWLESDLATNTQPWVVAFWHHPPYTKGSHNSDTEGPLIDMRQNALPILEAWGVDLVLSGHSHSYERSYLIDGHYGTSGTLDPVLNVLNPGDGWELGDGVYQKPDGTAVPHAGAVYAVAGSSGKVSGESLDHPAMFIGLNSLGSMVVDVAGGRMDVVFIDETGSVEDIFTIRKGPDGDPPLLSTVSAVDATHVLVDFSETLDSVEAENAANYSIAGLSISNATLEPNNHSVRLTTTAMTPEQSNTLFVSNVEDVAGNPIVPNSQASFAFFEFISVGFQDGLLPDPSYFDTQDGYIREASPDTAHGTEDKLQVDGTEPSGQTTDMFAMIEWDISSIPTDAIVESAQIVLDVTNVASRPYECYSLLVPWDETTVTWNAASAGVPWGSPGASSGSDRGGIVVCSVNASSTGPLTVAMNPDGLTLVQSWINTPSGNHGVIIADVNNTNGAYFHASESASAMSRPKLEITYRVPVVPPPVTFKLHTGVENNVDSTGWTTVTLPESYTSMVVVATPNYTSSDVPAVTRIQNASGNSFDVRLANPSGSAVSPQSVHYLVVEEGVFTQAEHGITLEAVKFNSSVTGRKHAWSNESRSYINSYSNPVVLGQVMSYVDPDWSVFWAQGSSRTRPPSASALAVGKHVGEDTDIDRADETLAYIVVEAGSGNISGLEYAAGVGSDIVSGMANSPPFSYAPTGVSAPTSAVASVAALDGGDGGWALLYGANPVSSGNLDLSFDEDQVGNSERSHTTEQVAYMVFGAPVSNPPPPGWIELTFDDFEGGWGNWVDGGSDARLTSGFAIGSQAMALQDNSSTSYSEMASSLDLSGYSELRIEFSYVVQSFENSEDFWVRFSSDGGSTWTTIQAFVNNVDFVDDGTRYDPVITIDSGSYTFNSNVKIMFQCDASGNRDDVYFDDVRISAQ